MIKIEINAENGADARKELIDLLGLGVSSISVTTLSEEEMSNFKSEFTKAGLTVTPTTVGNGEKTAADLVEQPAAVETTRRRRTKAEIEAEKAALAENTGSEEPPASEENAAKPEPSHPELPALQRVCAVMVRAGYKADAIKIIETVGKAASSADVLAENRQAVIDALTELAKQQNVTL